MNIDRIGENLPLDQSPIRGKPRATSERSKEAGRKDRLELSPEAKKLREKDLLEIARAELAKIPEVRQKKVDEVRGKVAQHYYDNEKVVRDIAASMAHSTELAQALQAENREAAGKADAVALKKLAVVFNRMDRKFYDSPEVMEKVARNLFKDLKDSGQI